VVHSDGTNREFLTEEDPFVTWHHSASAAAEQGVRTFTTAINYLSKWKSQRCHLCDRLVANESYAKLWSNCWFVY